MSDDTRGRPTKEEENRKVSLSEIVRSFETDFRLGTAFEEVERFLHSSGRRGKSLSDDIADTEVFGLFVVSRLWGDPVDDLVGGWLVGGSWGKVDRWKRLCERWDYRWETLKTTEIDTIGGFMAGWRMGCMVAAWRLMDECHLEGMGVPSVEEISGAAVLWLEERGVPSRGMATIKNKDRREFEKIALGWIPRGGLRKSSPPLFPEGFQVWEEQVNDNAKRLVLEEPLEEEDPLTLWQVEEEDSLNSLEGEEAVTSEDLKRFERRRKEELEFLRIGSPLPPE